MMEDGGYGKPVLLPVARLPGARSPTKDALMTSTVVLTCFVLAQQAAAPAADRPSTAPSPADIVASLESAMAERSPGPSLRSSRSTAIKAGNRRDPGRPGPEDTARVGGDRHRTRPAERRRRDGDDFISFDYGSGVVIGDQGEILTAFHVVRGADRLDVRAAGAQLVRGRGHRRRPAERPGRHRPASQSPGVGAPAAQAARRSAMPPRLRKGTFLVALGNPFNAARDDGSPSASWGILSNVARRLERPSPTASGMARRAAPELPDPAPARRQAEPRA